MNPSDASHANSGLRLFRVGVRYGSIEALKAIDLAVAPGEHLCIVGPSGSGKSTLLRCVAGLIRPDTGAIEWAGEPWSSASQDGWLEPRRRRIGMVAQEPALWPHMTARRHLAYVLGCRGVPRRERPAEAERMLALVSLSERAGHKPGALSGGEAQRLALARALVGGSRLLLLDEPLGQLDLVLRRRLGPEIDRIARAMSAAVLHVTHDPAEAFALADRILVLEEGAIAGLGTPAEILERGSDSPFLRAIRSEGFAGGRQPRAT